MHLTDPFEHPEALPAALLADVAAGLGRAGSLWRPHAHHGPERRPVRLLATTSYEAWVIGWTADQRVTVHDHGPSAGAVVVVEGALEEVVLDHGSHRRRRAALALGAVRSLPVGIVHDIVAPGPAPATSIHVYSPPLRSMGYYDDAGHRVRTEPVPSEPAVHDALSLARAMEVAAPVIRPVGGQRSEATSTHGLGPEASPGEVGSSPWVHHLAS